MDLSGDLDLESRSADWWIYLVILKEDKCADLDLESRWKFTDKGHLVVRGTLCLCVASTFDICQLFNDPVPVVHSNPTEAKEDSMSLCWVDFCQPFSFVNFSAPQISVWTQYDHKITMRWVFWGPDLKYFSTKVGSALYLNP